MSFSDVFSKINISIIEPQDNKAREHLRSIFEDLFLAIPASKLATSVMGGTNYVNAERLQPTAEDRLGVIRQVRVETLSTIQTAIPAAIELSLKLDGAPVCFAFNKVPVQITAQDTPESALTRYYTDFNNKGYKVDKPSISDAAPAPTQAGNPTSWQGSGSMTPDAGIN